MTREWLPVIALIDCGESVIMPLAPPWVTHRECGHISLPWRPSELCVKVQAGGSVPTACSPPYAKISQPNVRKVRAEAEKTPILASSWPFVAIRSLVRLCNSGISDLLCSGLGGSGGSWK